MPHSENATASKRRLSRELSERIDRTLRDPPQALKNVIAPWLRLGDAPSIADRVGRRATRLARSHRAEAFSILSVRDRLVLTLYHAESPPGWFTGWCDGSVMRRNGQQKAGIAYVLMEPRGKLVAETASGSGRTHSFEVEMEALTALLKAASELGAERLSAHTDCKALVERWLKRRDDPRLSALKEAVGKYKYFQLSAVPRRHNQIAHRLSRAAAVSSNRTTSPGVEVGGRFS